ncbi:hypothetical protein EW145_g2842 [Phellinidium pouzarii]|uniref:Uncharacterized protein n=1 Tax=Phellinidium pouzarii TaxID=167371 RepID=A0A4S4LEU5_9AGAM|nr:hypothetical protein EW145_g2842 [Phellinidium pouzarii]
MSTLDGRQRAECGVVSLRQTRVRARVRPDRRRPLNAPNTLSSYSTPLSTILKMNNGKKGPPQAPPKYLNDFSKALANEVRILLQEVGQLRDERRQLQYEIAELMAVKSKHGAGGEYTPDWRPPVAPEAIAPPPPPPAVDEGALTPAKPAWRTVVKHDRRERTKHKAPAAPPQIAAAPAPAPTPQMPAWAQWKPNPLLTPQPRMGSAPSPGPAPAPKPADGLFGPRTPPPK